MNKNFFIIKDEILSNNSFYDDKQILLQDNNILYSRFYDSISDNVNINCYNISTDEDLIFDTIINEYENRKNKTINDDALFNDVKENILKFAEDYICGKSLKKYERNNK